MLAVLENLFESLSGAWRFRRYAMLTAWAVCLLGWIVILFLPNQFEAGTRVVVETNTALRPVLQGLTMEQSITAQLNLARQTLLSRPTLEKVAIAVKLANEDTRPEDLAEVVDLMESKITVKARESGGTGTVFTITYRDRVRERSLRVVELLLNTFMSSTLGGKKAGSDAAQKFLAEQVEDYSKRLAEAEQRLADFKRKYVGQVPGAQGDYFTRLQAELDAIKKAQATLTIASSRREELQRQLRGDAALASAAVPTAKGGGDAGGGNDTASRIAETQARLEELLLRFTEKHPDVIALRETLAQLQQRRAEELAALRRGDAGAAARSGVATNPVYQSIQLQLNQADVEIAALRREIYDHNQKVAELRSMVNSAPEVEAQYAGLNRDYTVTQQTYQSLVDRLDKTRLGDEAGDSGAVQLSVVDPPNADFDPVSPKRFLLIPLTLLVGLGIGGMVAYLLHQMRPVFASGHSLANFTGLPLLGVVSLMWPERQQLESRRQFLRYGLLLGALVLVCAVVLWKQDPWSSAIRRMLGDRSTL